MRFRNQEKDGEILECVTQHSLEYNCPPTIRDISKVVGLAPTSVQQRVNKLILQGKLEKHASGRGYVTAQLSGSKRNVPLAGVVACGQPLFAEENIEEYLTISNSLLGGEGDYFALRCNGESMVNAGIETGDMVFVRKQNTANEGDIVVALCDDDSATLKRFYTDHKNKRFILHPENDDMEDIIVSECRIQGVAVKVLKDV